MNILVTGGTGFIGSNLVKKLKQENNNIIVIDNYSAGKYENEIPGVVYINEHTKNINKIELPFNPEIVFHLGEYSRIHPSFNEYDKVWDYNIVGTFEIINFCINKNIKIIYAGSSTRFAKEGISHSPYSFTKSMNVELIKAFSKWKGLQYSICYFYNVFGQGHNSSSVKGYESVISIFEEQYKNNLPLTVVGDGQQQRMFTFIDDIIDGLIKSSYHNENEEFELGNPKLYKIIDIAKMFSDNIKHIKNRDGDRSTSIIMDLDHTKNILNWSPTMNIENWIINFKNTIK